MVDARAGHTVFVGHPPPGFRQWVRTHPRLVDAILAVLIAAMAIGSLWSARNDGIHGHRAAAFVVLAALSSLPFAGRRRWPLATLLVLVAAQVVLQFKGAEGPGWLAA
ncbi:MAG: hypothetical protein JWM12_2561, partial [Ilumatobacteraceae bacterium]|nr:hypothetical protein [Ilumatobacteraceae bacterium]